MGLDEKARQEVHKGTAPTASAWEQGGEGVQGGRLEAGRGQTEGEVPSVRTARHRPSSRHCLAQNTHLRDQNSVSSEKLDTRPPVGRAETGGI